MMCKPCQREYHTVEECAYPTTCTCQHRTRQEPSEPDTGDPADC